jgi:hypothetical protein
MLTGNKLTKPVFPINGGSLMTKLLDMAAAAVILLLPIIVSAVGRDNASYVKIELKGIIQTQIMAIGGETTGVIIKVGDLSWDLDLGTNRQLHELAERLHGKTAVVRGTLKRISGIERGERDVVVVESLSESDK